MGRILYGAGLSTVVAAVLLIVVKRERRPAALGSALAATLLRPLAWNAILHRTAPAKILRRHGGSDSDDTRREPIAVGGLGSVVGGVGQGRMSQLRRGN